MLLLLLFLVFGSTQAKDISADTAVQTDDVTASEKVKFVFLYETGCPFSIKAYLDLNKTFADLGPYIDISTYPFGNANMIVKQSQMTIECQHGERECYGNRLHACAIDALKEPAKYIPFNSCMMIAAFHLSRSCRLRQCNCRPIPNDEAADACGVKLNVNAEKIKSCAKDYNGFLLHLQYGVKTNETHYPRRVPWWYVNGVPRNTNPVDTRPLRVILCSAFKKPPQVCQSILASTTPVPNDED